MKRIIPYILILFILAAFFAPLGTNRAKAETPEALGTCNVPTVNNKTTPPSPNLDSNGKAITQPYPQLVIQTDCVTLWQGMQGGSWIKDPAGKTGTSIGTTPPSSGGTTSSPVNEGSALKEAISDLTCNITSLLPGCLIKLSYDLFFVLPAWIMALAANFFNALAAISLSSQLYSSSGFIAEAWGVVRDLSNIFFILVLLYIAIKIILDLGGHEAKKMISGVIIMALLINFSMFFTKVVIDSSNILALIFYNKIQVVPAGANPRPYNSIFTQSKTGVPEKDVGGAVASSFNPARLMDQKMFAKQRGPLLKDLDPDNTKNGECFEPAPPNGQTGVSTSNRKVDCKQYGDPITPSTSFYLAIIFVSCAIFLFAAYAFFISAISFLGRLIELWILIIFSPFAFMSFPVPLLSGVDGIGWSSWSKRLLKSAFMAPIFMFFLYLISKMIQVKIFDDLANSDQGILGTILLIVIPAAVILVLLKKATEYAKKGGGAVGDAVMTAGKIVGGLAVGVATGGAAIAGRATIGRAGSALAKSDWANKYEARGGVGSSLITGFGSKLGSGSFDMRGIKVAGKSLASTGLRVGGAQTGGFDSRRQEQVAKRKKRADELEVGEDSPLKQNLNKMEADLKNLLHKNADELHNFDVEIKNAQDDFDAAGPAEKQRMADRLNTLREMKSSRKKEMGITELEKNKIPHAKMAIENENNSRKLRYAQAIQTPMEHAKQFLLTGGQYSPAGAREAAAKIITNAKVPDVSNKKAKPDYPKKEGGHDDHAADAHGENDHAADAHGDSHGGGGHAH